MRMKSRRPSHAATIPIAAQSIQDGKNEPMILIVGPIVFTCIYALDSDLFEMLQQIRNRLLLFETRQRQINSRSEKSRITSTPNELSGTLDILGH